MRDFCTIFFIYLLVAHAEGRNASAAFSAGLREHVVVVYKGAYVAYGGGRGSERELPGCSQAAEACNLIHLRFWRPPIVERLCRCPGHSSCPLQPTRGAALRQHLSNRATLQFCIQDTGPLALPVCAGNSSIGLSVQVVEAGEGAGGGALQSHTVLRCRCGARRRWALRRTARHKLARNSRTKLTHSYACEAMPPCPPLSPCSSIRPDTAESYYRCSCPPRHLCLPAPHHSSTTPAPTTTTTPPTNATTPGPTATPNATTADVSGPVPNELPHYNGPVLHGYCTPIDTPPYNW